MKIHCWIVLLALAGSLPLPAAEDADKQFNFAQQLVVDGDEAYAILEFRRFAYLYPDDERAPQTKVNLAVLYLTQTRNLTRARKALAQVVEDHPDTKAAAQAQGLRDFIRTNRDFDGQPLIYYLRGKAAEKRQEYRAAANNYLKVANDWPAARLTEQALYFAGRLQLHKLDEHEAALAAFQLIVTRYPKGARFGEALYKLAQAVERIEGPSKGALRAFQRAAAYNKDNEFGEKARAWITTIERRSKQALRRRHPKGLVRSYKVLKQTGPDAKLVYVVIIQVPTNTTDKELTATLEDALLKYHAQPKKTPSLVKVQAYFKHPDEKAGEVRWRPGQEPSYDIAERQTEDVLRSIFYDLLNP